MPTDPLLAAFALILIANAVLVAVSIRAMRQGAGGDAGAAAAPVGADPEFRLPAAPPVDPPVPARAAGSSDAMSAEVVRAVRSRRAILGEPAGEPRSDRMAVPEPKRRASPAARATEPRATEPRATDRARAGEPQTGATPTQRRSRRRFSLPPLDADHEKVSRSIESFLSGVDPAESAEGSPAVPSGTPTTVALVAVVAGSSTLADEAGPSSADTGRLAAAETARAIVERTLRGAARGSDTVTADEADRFRIVLAGTGELAARAYLRRIRAMVEPLLEAPEAPLRLVTATVTVLEGPPEAAAEAAGRRLEAAIARLDEVRAAPEFDSDEDEPEPRAAGD